MALKKSFTDSTGTLHPDSYWKILPTIQFHAPAKVVVSIAGYHNQASRMSELSFIATEEMIINIPVPFATPTSDIRALIYPVVKLDPKFVGSIDV